MLVDAISKAEALRKESGKEPKSNEETTEVETVPNKLIENVEVPNKAIENLEVPKKVIETVELVKRVFQPLKSLTEKGQDTQDKLDLFNKVCN